MKKERIQTLCFTLGIAFCFLAICSRSSFLYPFNNWDDSNSYFSMGKLMMNGGVIYRDLFDQKGPLLYFIYGIGYLLSHNTFYGVFVLEILSFTLFLVAEYMIARLYLSHRIALCLLPLTALAVTVSKSFYWGGSAEEFSLPFLAWGLWASLRYFKKEYPNLISWKQILFFGILAGCIMLIKYTLLGFYFAWMGMIALANLNRQNWKGSLRSCLLFLAGMALPVIPWFVYFLMHGALDEWYQAYIYCNVFLYSDLYEGGIYVGEKIYILAKIMYWLIWDNLVFFIPIIVGFFYFLVSKHEKWYEKINLYMLFGFLFLGIYIGGTTLYYYSLPLSIFSIFGFICIGKLLAWFSQQFFVEKVSRFLKIGATVGFVAVLGLSWHLSMNTEFMKQKKEDFFLYEFRDIVLREENPTLLNIGCLDAGLYTLADIVPTCRYFQSNAVHGFDEVWEEQLRYIEEGQTEFVLARNDYPKEIFQKYGLVSEKKYRIGDEEFTYYLFQKSK